MLQPVDEDAVRVLIDCMASTPALSDEEREQLHKPFLDALFSAMTDCGVTRGEAAGGALSFLNGPDPETFVKSIEHDLGSQVDIVSKSFSEYLTVGEIPAPHYAMRIAILLKKAKRPDLERDFLRAWAKHFAGRGIGMTYVRLIERLDKIEASETRAFR